MFSTCIEQIKADYSWYGSSNPIKFVGRVLYHPYLRLLIVFRLLTNINGGVKSFCSLYGYTTFGYSVSV